MPARRAQIDCYGRWTIKRGKQREAGPGDGHQRQVEIAVPVFGYKNHIGIDRAFGFLRGYTVAHAFNVENRVTRIPLRTRFQRCDQSGDRSDAGCCERSRAPPGCLRVVDVWWSVIDRWRVPHAGAGRLTITRFLAKRRTPGAGIIMPG